MGKEPGSLPSLLSALFKRMGRIERGGVQTEKEGEKRYEMKEKKNRLEREGSKRLGLFQVFQTRRLNASLSPRRIQKRDG